MCIGHFAKTRSWDFEKKEGLARTAHGRLNGEEIVFARPQTFMNLSGEAVKKLTIKYRDSLAEAEECSSDSRSSVYQPVPMLTRWAREVLLTFRPKCCSAFTTF
jgi:hypothetical protein